MDLLREELASIRSAIGEQTSAVQAQNEAENARCVKHEKTPPTVVAIQQLPADKEKKQNTRDNLHLGVQAITALSTTCAFVAAFWYACIAERQLNEFKREFSEQRAPWVGLENGNITVGNSLKFEAVNFNGKQSPEPFIDFTFRIKNTGPSPAHHEWETPIAFVAKSGESPLENMHYRMACDGTISPKNGGHVILPGAVREVGSISNIVFDDIGQTSFDQIWIGICIAYRDGSDAIHHSNYLFLVSHLDPSGKPQERIHAPGHPEWSYLRITGAAPISSDAE